MTRTVLLAILLCAPLAMAIPATPQSVAPEFVERFDAEVIPAGRSGRRGRVEIQITRWSTPDEKATLSALMQIEDPKVLVSSLEDLGPVGHIRYRDARPQPLRFARQRTANGRRTIVLFTDVSLLAASGKRRGGSDTPGAVILGPSSRRSPDDGEVIEIVELQLSEDGVGEGSWATGVRIGVNPDTGVAGILSSESVSRLSKVRPAD